MRLLWWQKCAVKPWGCSWYRIACRMSHNDMDSLLCVCACEPLDCVSRRMHANTCCTHAAADRRASSCVSVDWSGVGKPHRRPCTPRVFPLCVHVHVRAVHMGCQICVHIGCTDDGSCVSNVQSASTVHGHTTPLCHHRRDTALDVLSEHSNYFTEN